MHTFIKYVKVKVCSLVSGLMIHAYAHRSEEVGGQWSVYRPFPFQVVFMSSPPFLNCYAWGVQPAKHEEDWGRGLLGCATIHCV